MNDAGRIGFVIKGAYDASVTYDFLDVVYYNGASYVAKKLTIGNAPQESNEYWQVLAKSDTLTNISDATVDFASAQTRANIQSGEDSKTLFGKIKRWFTDFADVVFSGSYNDLSDTPESLKNPNALTFTGAAAGSYDGSAAKTVAIPSVGNGTLTIKKNGTNVQTFTANQSGNVTANITVPTSAADVSAVATAKVLTTKEQINANTDTSNVAGATAVKAMVSEINSNLSVLNIQSLRKNDTIGEKTDPNNLTLGIYQYWGTYFDSSPFEIPHTIISFNAQALVFQLGASYNGNLKYRTRGASATEWTAWYSIATN